MLLRKRGKSNKVLSILLNLDNTNSIFNFVEIEENQAKKAQQENQALQSPPLVKREAPSTPDYAAGLGSTTPAYAPATPQPTVTPTGKKYRSR